MAGNGRRATHVPCGGAVPDSCAAPAPPRSPQFGNTAFVQISASRWPAQTIATKGDWETLGKPPAGGARGVGGPRSFLARLVQYGVWIRTLDWITIPLTTVFNTY